MNYIVTTYTSDLKNDGRTYHFKDVSGFEVKEGFVWFYRWENGAYRYEAVKEELVISITLE
jgi:hypothetical protein